MLSIVCVCAYSRGGSAPHSVLLFADDYYYFQRCVCDPWSRQNLTGHTMCVLCVYTTNQNWPVYTREKKPQTIIEKKKKNIIKGTRGESERTRKKDKKKKKK